MHTQPAIALQCSLFLLVCLWAVWRGGWAERVVGLALGVQLLVDPLIQNQAVLNEVQWPVLAVDMALLAVLYAVALKSSRRWLLAATAFQLLSVLSQVVRIIDPTIGGWAYLTAAIGCGYAVLISLVIGTATSRPRGQRLGWRSA